MYVWGWGWGMGKREGRGGKVMGGGKGGKL